MDKRYPNKLEIDNLLKKGFKNNPGPWVYHSYTVGETAKLIARDIGLDENLSYAQGALHDIGRSYGFSRIKHILDGYNMLKDEYPLVAKVCMTHSFPIKDVRSYGGEIDVKKKEYEFIKDYINEVRYDDYDLLIQLLDSIVQGNGCVLQEKRMIDVIVRYGINEYTQEKIKRQIEIKEYFEDKLNTSIYEYTRDVAENTFMR